MSQKTHFLTDADHHVRVKGTSSLTLIRIVQSTKRQASCAFDWTYTWNVSYDNHLYRQVVNGNSQFQLPNKISNVTIYKIHNTEFSQQWNISVRYHFKIAKAKKPFCPLRWFYSYWTGDRRFGEPLDNDVWTLKYLKDTSKFTFHCWRNFIPWQIVETITFKVRRSMTL